ncbi:sensor histidine kinase [Oceanobacillus indicireducens]|uniref:histidine kinase n=1 Tax=Oceanobacillus indicireducens TaxID=1004261 RepID=A0A918D3B0_9BACI|nr:sensor histidine kinase [Oceanobacillus indicireducens]GGN62124.1 sensor histidine kinase [Oceanobacillus indicireducens]
MKKLFFRDQFSLIFLNIIQLTVMVLVLWLSGLREVSLIFYLLFLSILFLTGYLVYRYVTLRKFYQRLANPIAWLEEVFETFDEAPLSAALSELLKTQHRLYISEIAHANSKKNEHMTFINQWVHQMKTPLSVIELIIQEYEDEQILSIREETDKLEKGLEMVLYAARLEVFEQDFHVKSVGLKRAVEQVIRDNKRLFIKNRVYPELDLSEVRVESDEKWLVFVINQLITNAVKYSAGKAHKIYILEARTAAGVQLLIQDHGVGIPKSDIKRVFAPFFTGENGRIYRESTGMGLALVRDICDNLGHTVEIESTPGKGTLVKLTFPS